MQKRIRFSVAICIGTMLIAARWIIESARAQSTDAAATQSSSTTRPTDELPADSSIRNWFTKLADADPRARDQAREDLMGIDFDDLPKLRQLVIESQPISPDQIGALRDIVLQVFLAHEKYPGKDGTDTNAGGADGPFFLGILWSYSLPDEDIRLGVPVDERIAGFPSYRYLRRGDMIMGIFINPDAPLHMPPNTETHDISTLTNAISLSPRTQKIALQILRDGEMLKIQVKMAPRPMDATQFHPEELRQFISDRSRDADRYWFENFAPILERVADSD